MYVSLHSVPLPSQKALAHTRTCRQTEMQMHTSYTLVLVDGQSLTIGQWLVLASSLGF